MIRHKFLISFNKWLALFLLIIFLCLFFSCYRSSGGVSGAENTYVNVTWTGARPEAVLQTGAYPLWFQLTDEGPVHIVSIEDAVSAAAFIPWPYALHVRFLYKADDEIIMVVNRSGFIKIAPNKISEISGLIMHRFNGGKFWRQYTAGGFVFFEGKPAALLYLEDRFMETDLAPPNQRTWTFNMESNIPFPIQIPVLQSFPYEEGWEADTLRTGKDGLFYYRVANKSGSSVSVRMFRTGDLTKIGEEISIDVFYNSVPRKNDISHSLLPVLPDGFYYTGIEYIGDSIFASWEEQQDYSIGAAGFMLIKNK